MKIVEDEYTAILAQIKTATEAMNRAASDATKRIEKLEDRLVDLDPGVVVWGAVLSTEAGEHVDEATGDTVPVQRTATLGFGKAKKDWGFVVREEVKARKGGGKNGAWSVPVSEEIRPLRKAERSLRVLALPQLPALLGAVLAEVSAQAERLGAVLPQPKAEPTDDVEPIAASRVELS